jgi:hypothetical protein
MERFLAAFSAFHQTILSFLTVYIPQQLFSQLTNYNNIFHSHNLTKQTLRLRHIQSRVFISIFLSIRYNS